MTGKFTKNKKQTKTPERSNRAAQILFSIFAIILILSMVLSLVSNF